MRVSLSTFGVLVLFIGGALLIADNAHGTTGPQASIDQSLYAEGDASSTKPTIDVLTQERLPILVYHIVRPSYPSDSDEVKKFAITPELFDEQLTYLDSAGYTVIPLQSLENHLLRGTPLPPKPIVITFDDGWSDQYTYALPVLEKHKLTATFFVFSNAIGRKGFFTWGELKNMMAKGMTIGSHSVTHPYLTKISNDTELEREIVHSKEVLEEKLGTPITEFAYPFGQYDTRALALVKKAGYVSARGDYYHYGQSPDGIYELAAMNAPVTLSQFKKHFP